LAPDQAGEIVTRVFAAVFADATERGCTYAGAATLAAEAVQELLKSATEGDDA
jgi:hypothetical protein